MMAIFLVTCDYITTVIVTSVSFSIKHTKDTSFSYTRKEALNTNFSYSIELALFLCVMLNFLVLKSSFMIMVQFSSVAQSCLTLCDLMNRSMPGLPVHHQCLEFTQTHVHWVGDAIQPSHPLSFPSPPALTLYQHQGLFQWVNPSHEVPKVLEFQF